MGKTAAAAYADSVLKIPPAVSTKVTLDDRDAKAKRAAEEAQRTQQQQQQPVEQEA
jgi:hypothetical protein